MPTIEDFVMDTRSEYKPALGSAEEGWVIPVEAAVRIRKGQSILFSPPIGTWVGEPHPFQEIARTYNGQTGEVVDVRVKGKTHYDVLLKFPDGTEHWMWTQYLFVPAIG